MKTKAFKTNTVLFVLFIFLTFLYGCIGIYLNTKGCDLNLRWLFWNLFLAALPAGFAYAVYLIRQKFNWGLISLGLTAGWLLFLPNSMYMVTDLIHLDSSNILGENYTYFANLKDWINILYLGSGIFLGLVIGLYSTSLIHDCFKKFREIPFLSFVWTEIISLLVGYGVYIGRFLRLNSWDILHPRSLLRMLIENINRFTVVFSLMIAIIFFVSYWIYDRIKVTE